VSGHSTLLRVRGKLAGAPMLGRWSIISGEAREGWTQDFAPAPAVTVNHNLGRYPAAISVRTLGGVVADCEVRHVSPNQLRLYFDVPVAGVIEVG
jgi:hypothetical protein